MLRKTVMISAAGAAVLAMPLLAQSRTLGMLEGLKPGLWEMQMRDGDRTSRRICVRTGRELLQLRHGGSKCRSVTVNDTAGEVTVQYTCPGDGYGRTSVRRETDALVQIDSQGIAKGRPFAFAAEARRVSGC